MCNVYVDSLSLNVGVAVGPPEISIFNRLDSANQKEKRRKMGELSGCDIAG